MNRGTWWAAVRGVAESQIQLSRRAQGWWGGGIDEQIYMAKECLVLWRKIELEEKGLGVV